MYGMNEQKSIGASEHRCSGGIDEDVGASHVAAQDRDAAMTAYGLNVHLAHAFGGSG